MATVKFPSEMAPATSIGGNDKLMISKEATGEAYQATFNQAKEYLNITGIELEPLVGGDTSGTALVVAPGPSGEQRTAEVASGKYYDFGSGSVLADADKRWKAYWSGSSWSLKDMGALPTITAKTTLDPLGTGVANEKATADWVKQNAVKVSDFYTDITVGAINNSTSQGANYLVLNYEIPNDGVVEVASLRTPDTGIAKIVVLERLTRNYPTPTGGNVEEFKQISVHEITITTAGINSNIPINIPVKKGQYLGLDGQAETERNICRLSWQASAPATRGWWQRVGSSFNLTFQNIDFNFSFKFHASNYVSQSQLASVIKDVKYNYIIATRNAENYNSIRNIVKGITDATEYNRYVILVPRGNWFEVDIQGKNFVDIVGDDRDQTVLYCDGNDSTKVLPSDYYYSAEAGKTISSVNLTYLHVVFGKGNTNYSNLTLYQTRGKYAAHLDNVSFKELTFKNVRFKEDGGTSYPVGIGLRGGQKLNFLDCIFERFQYPTYNPNGRLAMFFHNWNNQASGCELNIINAQSINCGYILVDELGSGQDDKVNITNWQTNDIGQITFMVDEASGLTLWTNPATSAKEPDPKAVPYCISVNVFNTKVDQVIDRSASNFNTPYNVGTQRPKWADKLISDYFGLAMVDAGVTILKGQVLAYGSTQTSSIAVPTAKPFTGFSDSEILGVALEDSANGKVRYVPKGKYVETLVNGAIGTGDQAKKIVWDDVNKYMKADPTADVRYIQGIALANKSSGASYGIVKLK